MRGRTLESGRIIAKRGLIYFIYDSAEAAAADDADEARNLERLNNGEAVFNRMTSGIWSAYARRLKDAVEIDKYLQPLKN